MTTTSEYLLGDLPRTLFPLRTTEVLATHCFDSLLNHAYQKVLNPAEPDHSFLSQARCYASKEGLHLRRTVKLDPVAEAFIYDVVFRNRRTFRADFTPNRRSFGYRFRGGSPIPLPTSYSEFRGAIASARKTYTYSARFDISNYFNSLYHHDLVVWFAGGGRDQTDAEYLGQFLREANAGRSLDCLPQGYHPCKVIGAEFLKFVDNSVRVRSELVLRFMDDFYLFSDSLETLHSDFLTIQHMLGEKGLSLNAEKTQIGDVEEIDVRQEIDEIRADLLRVRRNFFNAYFEADSYGYDDEDDDGEVEPIRLDDNQIEYLLDLLKNPEIEESDAELVLSLLRDHGTDVLTHMGTFLQRFPSLSRNVYSYSASVDDFEELGRLIRDFINNGLALTEDQLFWTTKIAEDYLQDTSSYRDILFRLYEHPNATETTQAKLLEIPEDRFGLPDLREEQLRTGKSDWAAWAAAVGCRKEPAIKRNHKLGYFAKGSPMNALVASCIRQL